MIRVILLFGSQRADTVAPAFSSAEEGDVTNPTVAVVFSENINSPGNDYAAGVTIKVATVAATISSAVRQADKRIVYYVIATSADMGQAVTWEYDSGPGDLQDDAGNALASVAAQAVTNNVGEHWRFDHIENANQALLMGYD